MTLRSFALARLFHDPSDNDDPNDRLHEICPIWINDSGEWKLIVLDDLFPCTGKDPVPVFARPSKCELWVLMLEKAYAKLFGAYKAIEYGYSTIALRDLTGAPYETYQCKNADECWIYLKKAIDNKWLITANTRVKEKSLDKVSKDKDKDQNEDEDENKSLREEKKPESQHCYAVMELKDIPATSTSPSMRIIKLNNPWRTDDSIRFWKPDSENWPAPVRQQLGIVSENNNGSFWISIEQFVKEFSTGACCKIFEDYLYVGLRFWHDDESNNESFCILSVEKECHVFLGVSQKDERHFRHFKPKGQEAYEYSPVRVIVSRIDKNQKFVEVIDGNCGKERDIFIELNLQPGTYLIYIEIQWCEFLDREFIVNTYGNHRTILTEVLFNGKKDKFLRNLITKGAQKPVNQGHSEQLVYNHLKQPKIQRNIMVLYGFLIFHYRNNSPDNALREKVSMTHLRNLEIQEPYTNSSEFEIELLPGQEEFIIYKSGKEDGVEYQYKVWSQIFTSYSDPDKMKNFIISNAKKTTQKSLKDELMPVWVYTCLQPSRVFFLWVNESEYLFEEKITFQPRNLVTLDGKEQTQFEVSLPPHTDHLLVLKSKDLSQAVSFTYGVNFKFRKFGAKADKEIISPVADKNIPSPFVNEYPQEEPQKQEYPQQEEEEEEAPPEDDVGFDWV